MTDIRSFDAEAVTTGSGVLHRREVGDHRAVVRLAGARPWPAVAVLIILHLTCGEGAAVAWVSESRVATAPAEPAVEPGDPGASEEQSQDEERDGYHYPRFSFQGLGSAAYRNSDRDAQGVSRNVDMTLGRVDLLLQAELTDSLSLLAHLAGTAEDPGTEDFTDEQLQLAYTHSDALTLRLGKFHTPLGYWNRTYHNIPWLRTSITRPDIYRLEDDGGLLPVHTVGLQASGRRKLGEALDLSYSLSLVKGRGVAIGETVELDDIGDADGVNLLVALNLFGRGRQIDVLSFGLSGYAETISEDPTVARRAGEIDERILGAFLVWRALNFEVLGEYTEIRHDDDVTGRDFTTDGYYLQSSFEFRKVKLRLYERVDVINFANADPFFGSLDDRDLERLTLGARWDPRNWLAVTAEYARSLRAGLRDTDTIALQVTFNLGLRE